MDKMCVFSPSANLAPEKAILFLGKLDIYRMKQDYINKRDYFYVAFS